MKTPAKKTTATAAQTATGVAALAANAAGTEKFSLAALTYATVTPTDRSAKPQATIRQNGQMVVNAAAAAIIGYNVDGKQNPERTHFRVGADTAGNLYLVPAKEGEENVFKATKNNDGFQFRQDNVFAAQGAQPKDRYAVTKEQDGDVVYYLFKKLSKAEADAADAAENSAK